ncbi:MAG: hypothetical protein XD78_1502 [Desulfotomaculum sp. 46_296]|nr:MAG: hypothetical protein XD78_1502 [Desulfotomaculum sp. 46_296]
MATYRDIDARLEAAGLEHYNIDHERGVAVVFFRGLLAEEAPSQTKERQRREFREQYYWAGHELRRRKKDVAEETEA